MRKKIKNKKKKNILITGGAGFIGSNATKYFFDRGYDVTILDNFSRRGSKENAKWLKKVCRDLKVIEADIRKKSLFKPIIDNFDFVLHLAAQTAVTTSVADPRTDFEINAIGTLNLLEGIRNSENRPILIYSSTNKVYGNMEGTELIENETRYDYKGLVGVHEFHNLDFHSPYGCSKGIADQYVRDYARIFGLDTIVFRQSCIYGPRQFGIEDQGWIAWFIIAILTGKKITIYGDGKQVRDILYIDDLVRAYDLAFKNAPKISGHIFNIGGGRENSISIWHDFLPILESLFSKKITSVFSDWRPGDQKVFITDFSKFNKTTGWKPRVNAKTGIKRLYNWIKKNKSLFS